MMRGLLYALSVAAMVALAFWAYREGYETRNVEREVARLEAEIGARHQELSMLRAEWAYLNRPARLRDLAEMNFETLGLMPLSADHFARVDQVSYPVPTPSWLTDDEDVEVVEEVIDDVVVMNHVPGSETEPRIISPPTLARDGELLP